MQLDLTTPTLLFSAISLIMLAYTNRFLAYSSLVRSLRDDYLARKDDKVLSQIKNLYARLYLTKAMQFTGIFSLLLCVVSMFLVYIQMNNIAIYVFGVALFLLIISLGLLMREIQISVKSLEIHLNDIKELER